MTHIDIDVPENILSVLQKEKQTNKKPCISKICSFGVQKGMN